LQRAARQTRSHGKIKQGEAKQWDSDRLQIEGEAQEAKGAVQKAVGDAKAATKDAENKAANFVNRNF
jgi:uncharacterized protein YjbJ (UPF0337 family)